MANTTIYPYGVGGQTPSGIGLNAGTFADAYDLAKENNYIFPWMLIDEDENGEPIKKMIWHTGNGKFIDAIGAEISGSINGLTVTVTKACDMVVNGTTYSLSEGDNNFLREDLSISANGYISNEIKFYDTGTTTSTNSSVTAIDFGDIPLRITSTESMGGFTNLTKIKRLNLSCSRWFYEVFNGCKVSEIKASGSITGVDIYGIFSNCTLLEKADFSELTIRQNNGGNQMAKLLYNCPLLREVDVRLLDLSKTNNPYRTLSTLPSLKKLTIGENFTNTGFTQKGSILSGVSGVTLFVMSSTPPKLKNCSFTDSVANDEHATTYDWLSYTSNGEEICRFDAIYVPDEAVQTYKTDVYVENGTVGNTGWSYYADIIKPMSEYVE